MSSQNQKLKIAVLCNSESRFNTKYRNRVEKFGKVLKILTLEKVYQDTKTSATVCVLFRSEISHMLQERFIKSNPSTEIIEISSINELEKEMERYLSSN